ncbi:MAG TPA: RNA polymerase sigma factor [Bacilli bacterium]|nr:RNA polymerase sigma factor [Bacilli bacterium]
MKYEVLQKLYQTYMKQIYFYLQKVGCKKADAEDIVQDTFAKAIEYFDAIDVSKFRSWLFRVALNQYYDLCRKEKRHPIMSIDEHEFLQRLQTDEFPELLLLSKEKGEAIANVLSQLKTTEQHLLFMKYELDYSYKVISELLQLNENTVKTYLFRARNKFKTKWEEQSYE